MYKNANSSHVKRPLIAPPMPTPKNPSDRNNAEPSTNTESVPDGLEGSIDDNTQPPSTDSSKKAADATEVNGDRPQGNERRSDDE